MGTRQYPAWVVVFIFATLSILACDAGSLIGGISGGAKPIVAIQSPSNGSQFKEGEEVTIQSAAKDSAGVVRVELSVDGAIVRSDAPPVPQGQVSFTLVQTWKATAGTHTLSVRAFNKSGTASDPALITLTIGASTASGAGTSAPTSIALVPGTELAITPLPTLLPTVSVSLATATRRPPTRAPSTPTISAPPGVYALSMRVDPPDPKRGYPPNFFVTFLNSTGKVAGYRWFVKVYEPDKANSKGETSRAAMDFPPGTSELSAPADWAIRGPGPCEPYVARVFWFDRDSNQANEFLKPDGSGGPAVAFQVCP